MAWYIDTLIGRRRVVLRLARRHAPSGRTLFPDVYRIGVRIYPLSWLDRLLGVTLREKYRRTVSWLQREAQKRNERLEGTSHE